MADTLAGSLRDELLELLAPLAGVGSPTGLRSMLQSLGHSEALAEQTTLQTAMQQAAALVDELSGLDDAALAGWEGIARLLQAAADTFDAVRGVEQAISDPTLLAQAEGLGEQIAGRLVALHLRAHHPALYRVAGLLTLVIPAEISPATPLVVTDGQIVRVPSRDDRFQFDRLSALLREPATTLRDAYFPHALAQVDDAYAAADLLLPLIGFAASTLGLRSSRDLRSLDPPGPSSDDPSYGDHFSDAPVENGDPGEGDPQAIRLRRLPQLVALLPGADGTQRLGVGVTVSSAEHEGGVAGVILSLDSALSWSEAFGSWTLDFSSDGGVPAVVIGPQGLSLAPIESGLTAATGRFSAKFTGAPGRPAWRLGSDSGTRLELGSAQLTVDFTLSPPHSAVALTAAASNAVLVLTAGDGDSFLSTVLPAGDIRANLDFGIIASSETGLHLKGGVGLSTSFPLSLTVGPARLDSVKLAVITDTGVAFEATATVSVQIGPVTAAIDGAGLRLAISFPSGGGNLGPIDLDPGFRAPTAVGLSVDADIIAGGGFVDLDPASGRYSGVLDLHTEQIGITALGLIDTKLPGGQSGYSLLLALRATFPAIQIGFGFALTSVGGLLGLNRKVNIDVLRARLAAGTAGRILSPQDPVRNAPALLADLDAVFPPTPGVTVVGPTVQLVWADLVHFDIGVFIELPGPTRVVLLGSAHAEIERDGRAYLSIRVDVVGVVDLRGQTAAFDAVLIDSHLMGTLDLTGGAALRMSWGTQPYAVLSLGGFNPAYHPEPLSFPATLTRIAMVHGSPSDELYLRFEGYFAVTSNTLQFGASVEVAIHADPFTVHGSLGFDALIEFEPFHFQIDIRASVSLAYHGHTLAGLTLTGALTGPGPVVLHAKVCIELLFFDICYSGTFTLGPSSPPPVPPVADLLDLLLAEAADPARLRAAGTPDPYVRLTPPDPSLTIPVVTPTGTLVWEQRRAPLDLLLTRVGGTPLPAPVQVSAAVAAPATATTTPATATAETDWFAPGQFTDLTDDQALTRPAYELLASGLRLAGTGTADGPSAQATRATKEILLPAKPDLPDKEAIMFPAWILTSATGPPAPAVTVTTETWIVTTPAGARSGLTGAQARQLATMTASARAIPAADRLAAFPF